MEAGSAMRGACLCLIVLLAPPFAVAERRSGVKLELTIPRDRFLLGESISVGIRLENTGAATAEVPKLKSMENTQPVYRIEGPSFPTGASFTMREAVLAGEPGALGAAGQPSTLLLSPGQATETGFKLNERMAVEEPGEYRLSASIDWQGRSAEAAPVQFRLERATYLDASLGVDFAATSSRMVRAVWIAQTDSGRVLGETFQYENRPDLAEVRTTGTRIITPVGPAASHPFCPWTNFDRGDAASAWHGWQEDTRLLAIAMGESRAQEFDLGSDKATVVRPALLSRDGNMDVLVIDASRRSLQLIRFFAPIEGEPRKSPARLWRTDLTEDVEAAHAAIGPEREGGSRLVILASQTARNIALRLLRVTTQGAQLQSQLVVENGFLIPRSEPGLTIAQDGSAKAALLFARDPERRVLAIADVSVPKAGGNGSLVTTELGKVASQPVAAASVFRATPAGQDTRSWFAGLADGGVVGGGRSPQRIEGITQPRAVDFLRLSVASYVLVIDPTRGPTLHPARI